MILSGKVVRDELKVRLANEFKKLPVVPELVIIQVGNNADSSVYIRQKKIFGASVGIPVHHKVYPENVGEWELIRDIQLFNKDDSVAGIIVQLPLPKQLNRYAILNSINPDKDIDGLGFEQIGRFFSDAPSAYIPATARGIISLCDYYNIDLVGKHVVVVGRSKLVGRPTAMSFLKRNATVTICHSHTKNLRDITKSADIVVVAIGKSRFVDASYIIANQVVIDVGINKTNEGISGDVDYETVKNIVSAVTPVPGGVGPLTVLSLFQNLLDATRAKVVLE